MAVTGVRKPDVAVQKSEGGVGKGADATPDSPRRISPASIGISG
jgi:hypothetical protein